MRAGLLAGSLIGALSLAAMAQQPPPPPPSGAADAAIHLNVVVTPAKSGKPVSGLNAANFTILDNGAQQPLASFRAMSGQADPVKVLLVIDAVNLDFERVAYERQQLDKFLRANDGQLSQPTALAIFTDTSTQVQTGYSRDGNAMADQLAKQVVGLRELRRSAGFFGAAERLDLSLKTLGQIVAQAGNQPGRKSIVWITPGWPLLSGPGIQLTAKDQDDLFRQVVGFSDALRRANVTLYALDPLGAGEGPGRTFYFEEFLKGITKPSQAVPGDLGAQVLAVQSGGLFLGSSNDLGMLLQRPYDDASSAYEITYRTPPAEKANEYHKIEVRLNEPNLKARTRQGYYAGPSESVQQR